MQDPAARAIVPVDLPHRGRTGIPCQDNDAELWFAEDPDDVELAKSLCLACPMREACLAGALERGEPWGVWGGQLLAHGVIVGGKRRRGRPRRNEAA
ncbi:Transcription factor WhiB [Intrasporangium chromatireducens Q5-1]|uniref:Transcriptional regulator WhiB n=1 Tax=Intrasporangium chromatireducens Q5-1 TaxID=584657 RepID=W9GT30_9MICO|nr:WhiB family transcriptional regulator [Intrasporangium chromatireducens]EWT07983.1 Transcription factor WhiB [Intrasporangium chromatireducens Q5-1]